MEAEFRLLQKHVFMKIILRLQLIILLLNSCASEPEIQLGHWRGIINVQGNEMPFNFRITRQNDTLLAYLKNGNEEILLDEVSVQGDSLIMDMHIFDSDIRAYLYGDSLSGIWQKKYIDGYQLEFKAYAGDSTRFPMIKPTFNFDGKWKVKFSDEKIDSIYSVGIFNQSSSGALSGTFLNSTGDYRTLEGSVQRDTLLLSTFDGGHAFLFKAYPINDSSLVGEFWSGKSSYESWTATRDENAKLQDENRLTFLKDGYDSIFFTFPDLNGNLVSLSNERFRNKVVILQIFGSWCPNCMDETLFLSKWYTAEKQENVEILGLSYEVKDDFNYASGRVRKMKKKLNIPYEFVIAGTNDKKKAESTLPMLNQILAFPTMIFIDRKGEVRRIHTGFNGPGTGIYHEQFVLDFTEFMDQLIKE